MRKSAWLPILICLIALLTAGTTSGFLTGTPIAGAAEEAGVPPKAHPDGEEWQPHLSRIYLTRISLKGFGRSKMEC